MPTARQKRNAILQALETNKVKLTFLKNNGEERVMNATRALGYGKFDGTDTPKQILQAMLMGKSKVEVFDLDEKKMKAFVFGRLLSYQIEGEQVILHIDEDDSKLKGLSTTEAHAKYKARIQEKIDAKLQETQENISKIQKADAQREIRQGGNGSALEEQRREILDGLTKGEVTLDVLLKNGAAHTFTLTRTKGHPTFVEPLTQEDYTNYIQKGLKVPALDINKNEIVSFLFHHVMYFQIGKGQKTMYLGGPAALEKDQAQQNSKEAIKRELERKREEVRIRSTQGSINVFTGESTALPKNTDYENEKNNKSRTNNAKLSTFQSEAGARGADAFDATGNGAFGGTPTPTQSASPETKIKIKGKPQTFKTLREARSAVLDALENGNVELIFTKAAKKDGTPGELRVMNATRKPGNGAFANKLTDTEREALITRGGRVEVFDLSINETRAFVFERLHSYEIAGKGKFEYDEASLTNTIAATNPITSGAATAAETNSVPVGTPEDYSVEHLMDLLGDNVLRIHFIKQDKTPRTMYATRNRELIAKHSNPLKPIAEQQKTEHTLKELEEKKQAQIDGDYIRVYDLENQDFKTFKPSSLTVDSVTGIPHYLVFPATGDEWFLAMQGVAKAESFYVKGKFEIRPLTEKAKAKLGPAIQALKLKETRNKATQEFRDSLKRRGDETERFQVAVEQAKGVHKKLVALTKANKPGALTIRDEDVFADLVRYATTLEEKLQAQHTGKSEITNLVISQVKKLPSAKLVIFVLNFGDNVIIMHPRFVIDGISHRVLFGKKYIAFDDARLSNNPTAVHSILKDVQGIYRKYAGERLERESNSLNLRNKRAARHVAHVASKQEESTRVGLAIQPLKAGLSVLSVVRALNTDGSVKGVLFFNQTAAYYQAEGQPRKRIYRPKKNPSVKSLLQGLGASLQKEGFAKQQIAFILQSIQESYSLRPVIDTTVVEKALKLKLIPIPSDAKIEKPKRAPRKNPNAS